LNQILVTRFLQLEVLHLPIFFFLERFLCSKRKLNMKLLKICGLFFLNCFSSSLKSLFNSFSIKKKFMEWFTLTCFFNIMLNIMHFYYLIFRIIFVHLIFFIIIFLIWFFSCFNTCIFFKFCKDSFYFILYSWMNHLYFHFQGIHSSFMKKLYVFSSSEDCSMFDLKLELTALISSPKN
jgi:hypothetical protein